MLWNNLPPTIQFEANGFDFAWENALKYTLTSGKRIIFGGEDEPKDALDTVQTIVLNKRAVHQILEKQIHKNAPFKLVNQYVDEFTIEFLEKYHKMPEEQRFDYIYYDRLNKNYQIENVFNELGKQMESGIKSNRCQMITWIPEIDQHKSATPCLQRIRIRYEGDGEVSVHLDWRSRDLFNAWQVNLIGIVTMLQRDIIEPNNCSIARIIDRNDSLHIYKSDIKAATKVIADGN